MFLYLDIDGVMVAANSWRKLEILEDGFPAFEARAVAALCKILRATNATIVLITSHKTNFTLKEWEAMFERRGIKIDSITRLPENIANLNRKDELLAWFQTKPAESNFIIIDDDKSLNALPAQLKKHLIQTSASVGLTDYLADEALRLIEENQFALS